MSAGFYGIIDFTGLPVGIAPVSSTVQRSATIVAGRRKRLLDALMLWELEENQRRLKRRVKANVKVRDSLKVSDAVEKAENYFTDVTLILAEV